MKYILDAGSKSQVWQVFVRDSSSGTGAGLTGLAFNTAGLTAYYKRSNQSSWTAISLVTMTAGTFTSGGFVQSDAANAPGWYDFCPPDACFASGASVAIHLKGATNMAPMPLEAQVNGVTPGSTLTLAASRTFEQFTGNGWVLALGTQNIEGSYFYGAESISGVGTGNVFPPLFKFCGFANVTLPPIVADSCNIMGTFTVGAAGNYVLANCESSTPTIGALAIFDRAAAVGAVKVNLRKYSGSITLKNLKTGDLFTIDGDGINLTIDATCTGGSIVLRGTGTYTDSVVGGFASVGTLSTDALLSQSQIADGVLNRDMSTGTDSGSTTVRTVRQALRALRNKWTNIAGTYTVYKENDTAVSWTGVVSTDTTAAPIVGNDPAG